MVQLLNKPEHLKNHAIVPQGPVAIAHQALMMTSVATLQWLELLTRCKTQVQQFLQDLLNRALLECIPSIASEKMSELFNRKNSRISLF